MNQLSRVKLVGLVAIMFLGTAQSQDLRDPTVPPLAAIATPGVPGASTPSPLGAGVEGFSVIVRDGKAGLVVGTRVVQPGQKLGRWVLERITETEIWLRDGSEFRKISRFSGIQRHDPDQAPVCAVPGAASPPTRTRPGKGVKPAPTAKTPAASTKADTQCDAPPTRSSNP